MEEFNKDFSDLVQNPFGNYSIQFAIEAFGKLECKEVINKILENILSLSLQKFSSNVVERCLEKCDEEILKRTKALICQPVNFILLLKNKFGNFVLKKLLTKFQIEEKPMLKQAMIKAFNMSGNKEKIKLNNILKSLEKK